MISGVPGRWVIDSDEVEFSSNAEVAPIARPFVGSRFVKVNCGHQLSTRRSLIIFSWSHPRMLNLTASGSGQACKQFLIEISRNEKTAYGNSIPTSSLNPSRPAPSNAERFWL